MLGSIDEVGGGYTPIDFSTEHGRMLAGGGTYDPNRVLICPSGLSAENFANNFPPAFTPEFPFAEVPLLPCHLSPAHPMALPYDDVA